MGNTTDINKQKVERSIGHSNGFQPVKSDKALYNSDTFNLSEHNKLYTELLKAYVQDFRTNSFTKRISKHELFDIAKKLLLWIPISTFIIILIAILLLALNVVDIIEILPELIAAIATLLGTFLVIPKMITKYLFNKEEEKYLAEIIGKIQKYDRNIRDGL